VLLRGYNSIQLKKPILKQDNAEISHCEQLCDTGFALESSKTNIVRICLTFLVLLHQIYCSAGVTRIGTCEMHFLCALNMRGLTEQGIPFDTKYTVGHFGNVLPSQSLGSVPNKLNPTKQT